MTKRLILIGISLVMILCLALAQAEDTSLSVSVYGMKSTGEGQWQSEMITCCFDVFQHDTYLGVIDADVTGNSTVSLIDGSEVTLIPQSDTLQPGYAMDEEGYSLAVTEGMPNVAHLLAYANVGKYCLMGAPDTAYILTAMDADGAEISEETVTTDAQGLYMPEGMAVCGDYRVTSADDPALLVLFSVIPYRGNDAEMAQVSLLTSEDEDVDADAEEAVEQTGEETEEEMLPESENAAESAALSVPEEISLQLDVQVDSRLSEKPGMAVVTLVQNNRAVQQWTVSLAGGLQTETVLPTGAYQMRLLLPDNAYAQCEALPGVSDSLWDLGELTQDLSLSLAIVPLKTIYGTVPEGARVSVQGEGRNYPVQVQGEYWSAGYIPQGTYTLTVTLPDGSFAGDGWEWTDGTAQCTVEVLASDDSVSVPAIVGQAAEENTEAAEEAFPADDAEPDVEETEISNLPLETEAQDHVTEEIESEEQPAAIDSEADATIPQTEEETSAQAELTEETEAVSEAPEDAGDTETVSSESADDAEDTEQEPETGETPAEDDGPDAALEAAAEWEEEDAAQILGFDESALDPDREASFIPLRELERVSLDAGTGRVEVLVFSDANHNGEKGKYEMPVDNAVIDLIVCLAEGDRLAGSVLTDENGTAVFENLPEGDYRIRSQLPVYYGYGEKSRTSNSLTSSAMERQSAQNQESEPFHISEGGSFSMGIGATPAAGISGRVWLDSNGDGIMQSDEPGQQGVLVEMVGLKNGLTYQLITGEDGYYNFTQLRLGSYKIRVTLPSGMMFTRYSKAGGSDRSIFTDEGKTVAAKNYDMNKAHVEDNQNIGVYGEAGLTGYAFLDVNYSGTMDAGDLPLSGVKITVYRQSTNVELTSTITGADGQYAISALRPGAYRVRATLPENVFYTRVVGGETGNRFRRVTGRRDSLIENVTLGLDEVKPIYIGAVQPSVLSGTVYMDQNFNGQMDTDEQGVAGLTVRLMHEDGTELLSVRTDRLGQFRMEEVVPGAHYLEMQAPSDHAFTRVASGNCMISRGAGLGTSEVFVVQPGSSVAGMDAGLVLPGTVYGRIFADENDSSGWDEGEGGLKGSTVTLYSDEGDVYTAEITDSADFLLDSVLPGSYYAEVTLPDGAAFTQTSDWSAQGGKAISPAFHFQSGEQYTLSPVGGITFGSVDGVVFVDPSAQGILTEDAERLAGAVVTLTPETAKGDVQVIATGEDGAFHMEGIRPGTYTLSLTLPGGYVLSRRTEYTLPLEPCQSSQSVSFPFPMGSVWQGENLGAVIPGSLSGFIWLDADQSGKYDASSDLPGKGETIAVVSTDTGDVITTLTADAQGQFSNDGMIPGSYALVYALDDRTLGAGEDSGFVENDSTLVLSPVEVRSNETVEGLQLGLVRLTEISGQVWVDQQGEIQPLSGARVTLYNVALGRVEEEITTDETGMYRMRGLLPGAYQIAVVLPEGQIVAEMTDERLTRAGLVSIMTSCQGRNGETDVFTLVMGEDLTGHDIGSVLPGNLGDLVWLDENNNGLYDTDESGIAGLTVHLYRGGREVAQTVTDSYGFYRFDELYPAIYTLSLDMPGEVQPTSQREDFPGISSVLMENGFTREVQVISNASNDEADMGLSLVTPGVYPQGVHEGASQDWSGFTEPGWS
ncbi:MAG: carboxypeptidase regulatory-like domain-containing protein [Clostridia bacterium]|nr:carboxypeptidase regulatory-like domain-containing protein [Clostridia bacterium]